jgi:putative ABC transport system permease protein
MIPMDFRRYVRDQLPSLPTPREPEILEELAQHLEDLYREQRSAGLDHHEALARASRALTTTAHAARDFRSASRGPGARLLDSLRAALDEPVVVRPRKFTMLSDLKRDVRYALRSLIHAPGFTAVAVVTLATGIGATAVIFSAIDAVLLRGAPVAESDRVVSVYTQWAARATTTLGGGPQMSNSSYPDYADLRESGVLADLAAFSDILVSLDADAGAERIDAQVVSGNYFDVLGVGPLLGRGFAPNEDVHASPVRVVVLSHALWQQRFGGDTGIVGRTITLNRNSYAVIGVAPRGFAGPVLGNKADAWVPMALQEEVRPPSAGALRRRLGTLNLLGFRDVRWVNMVGRLRDGQSVTEATAALDVVGQRLAAAYPDSNKDLTAAAVALGRGPGVRTRTRPVLLLLAAAVALVLLIACANVAGLMLTRAVARRREVAVRLAVGAGRGQLIRQWLTEAVLLGLAGAGVGLLLVGWAPPILHGLGIPDNVDLRVNVNVLVFTLAVGLSCGLVFGLCPVLQFVREDVLSGLRDEGNAVATSAGATRLRSAFVIVQVALSFVLLIGAGLFLRTLMLAYAVDLGYDVNRMLVADLSLDGEYSAESGMSLYDDLLNRVSRLPGVLSAGAARVTVLSGTTRTVGISADGQPIKDDRSNAIPVRANSISRGYLDTMGIHVIRGRQFDVTDVRSSPHVAIISQALGERLWPGADAIGRVLVGEDGPLQVVGVVPDTVYLKSTELEPWPFFYTPLSQNFENAVSLHIRTVGDPLMILGPIRQVLRGLDPRLALSRPRRLVDEFHRSVETERVLARLTGILGGIALLLAAVGLYGVMAYTVRQRTREVGLRLAIGATPAAIMQLIVGRGARLVAVGVAFGLVGAAASVRLMRAQLFGVEPTDPVTWLGVGVLLAVVGLVACGIPARRAMKTAPAVVLRTL